MRIAVFHNLPSGGAKRAVYEWVRRLASSHTVDVFTLSSADHGFCDLRPVVGHHFELPFALAGLFESPFGRLNQVQRWRDVGRINRLSEQVAKRIDEGAYDIVFSNPCQYTAVPAILRFLGTKAVHFLHEPVGRALVRRPPPTEGTADQIRACADRFDPLIGLYGRRLDMLQLAALRRTPRLLANSVFTRTRMAEAYGVDAPVCRLGVDASVFRPLPGVKRQDHVLSVGELSFRKGFDFLIKALSLVPVGRRPTLRIACNSEIPSERRYIERLAATLGVTLEIRVGLSSVALCQEYNRAALCVYAPVEEPFGLVPLESMACGTSVVSVLQGGVPESLLHEHTGLLVSRDLSEFAEAVQRLIADAPLRAQFGRNGREHVLTNWTWDRSVAELEWHLSAVARHKAAEPGFSSHESAVLPAHGGSRGSDPQGAVKRQ